MTLSLALHAALLLPWPVQRAPHWLHAAPLPGSLDVQLADTTPARARGAVSRPHGDAPRPVQPPPAAMPQSTASPAPSAASEAPSAEAGPAQPPNAGIEPLAQRLLAAELARYFTYPPLARRHGWEGQVLLSLTIEPDGHLQNLRLAMSSGHAVLDHAALGALRRVGRAPAWRGPDTIDVRLPVIYRLRE